MEHPYSLALHSIHRISTHMHFSLGPIFDFAKYLRQVCLSFSPYLELHQKAFRSRRKKAYKKSWWGYKHFWANESVIRGTCLYFFENFWKPQNKWSLDDEKYLPEPYAWSLQRNIFYTCCLCLFELCQILWPLWVAFYTLMTENHVHTTSIC